MSSCRGRAEAFARRLSSKLRTLGSQAETEDLTQNDETVDNSNAINSWIPSNNDLEHKITELQPLHHESNYILDLNCEVESPGSPVDECEYTRLIETAPNTPHSSEVESGYAYPSTARSHSFAERLHCNSTTVRESSYMIVSNARKIENDDGSRSICETTNANTFNGDKKIDLFHQKEEKNEYEYYLKFTECANKIPDPHISMDTLTEVYKSEQKKQTSFVTAKYNGTQNDKNTLLQVKPVRSLVPAADTANLLQKNVDTNIFEENSNGGGNEIARQQNVDFKNIIGMIEEPKFKSVSEIESFDRNGDDESRPQRVRRCSSLKTSQTPPGTPGRKKIVRFADALGLDLADIKTFLDEIPTIPKSAFYDLEIGDLENPFQLKTKLVKFLSPLFQQPGGLSTFLDIVREKQVSLENAAVTDHLNHIITGCVRVRNLDFYKSVHIRYTIDNWRSFADLQANYVHNSCDGFSDKFTFFLFGNTLQTGQRLEFAVRFKCKGQEFWDNNYGTNYCFQCLPTSSP